MVRPHRRHRLLQDARPVRRYRAGRAHAVNWQVKQSPLGEESEVPTDLVKLLKIIRESGYCGYLPIETLSPRGKAYDPYTVVPAFLEAAPRRHRARPHRTPS